MRDEDESVQCHEHAFKKQTLATKQNQLRIVTLLELAKIYFPPTFFSFSFFLSLMPSKKSIIQPHAKNTCRLTPGFFYRFQIEKIPIFL